MIRTAYPLQCRAAGFTLVEIILAIVISGIAMAMVGLFVRTTVLSYTGMSKRAELVDVADTALRRISRDLHRALPNSVRLPADQCLEFIPTITGARYRSVAPNNIEANVATSSFNYFGTLTPAAAANDHVVIYNLGIPGADAYTGVNRATIANINTGASTINLTGNFTFPFDSPALRFQIVPDAEQAVMYAWDSSTKTLYRYSHYGFDGVAANNCNAPVGASPTILATNVSNVVFGYSPGISQRNGLVTLSLEISNDGGTVNLYHEVHVNNVP